MLKKKLSEACNRKRKNETETASNALKVEMATSLKKFVIIKQESLNSDLDSKTNVLQPTHDVTFCEDDNSSGDQIITVVQKNNEFSTELDKNIESNSNDVIKFQDVGYLEFDEKTRLSIISQSLRDEMVLLGSHRFQNRFDLPIIPGERFIKETWFKRQSANGEQIFRSWLLYSPIKKSAFCFCCLLFKSSKGNSRSAFELTNGFNKWRKPEKLQLHEKSRSHLKAYTAWKEAEMEIGYCNEINEQDQRNVESYKIVNVNVKRNAGLNNRVLTGFSQNISTAKMDDVNDEYGNFGKYVASQLRELSIPAAVQTQMDIITILTNAMRIEKKS